MDPARLIREEFRVGSMSRELDGPVRWMGERCFESVNNQE